MSVHGLNLIELEVFMDEIEIDNSLANIATSIWFGMNMDELMMERLFNERMLGKKIDHHDLELFENRSLGRLLFKVLPIFKPFDEEIIAKINRNEEKVLLEDLDISEDGYLNAYNFYHGYGMEDDRIAQIFIHHILKSNIIKNKPKNDKGLDKLFPVMNKHALSYILLLDSY